MGILFQLIYRFDPTNLVSNSLSFFLFYGFYSFFPFSILFRFVFRFLSFARFFVPLVTPPYSVS